MMHFSLIEYLFLAGYVAYIAGLFAYEWLRTIHNPPEKSHGYGTYD